MRDFRRTYLERDLADLGRVSDLDQFALAQNLLAARTACLLSYSEVSRELGVAVNTVKRYMRFLEISYQISLLRPLATSLTTRLVKAPKLYWTDPGLARVLSERMESYNGPLYETAVFNELQRWSTWQPLPPSFYFFRTHGGNEVDFVMYSTDVLIAMEVKSSEKAHRQDTRTLTDIIRKLELSTLKTGATRLGLLVYRGRETALLAPHIWAIPDWQLFGPTP